MRDTTQCRHICIMVDDWIWKKWAVKNENNRIAFE